MVMTCDEYQNLSFSQREGETVPVLKLHFHWGPGRYTSVIHAPAQTCGFTGHAGAQGASGNARGLHSRIFYMKLTIFPH